MFWRFGGYASISTIDTILDKPDVTLEELLDESDLIQELKSHNTKLIEYLREDAALEKLLQYVVAPKLEPVISEEDEDDEEKGKESKVKENEREQVDYGWRKSLGEEVDEKEKSGTDMHLLRLKSCPPIHGPYQRLCWKTSLSSVNSGIS